MRSSLKSIIVVFMACFCLAISGFSQAYKWKNVAIGAGGFVSAIIPSQTVFGLMYARTDVGGAYRWEADTQEWVPLNDWSSDNETGYLGVESLALDPNDSDKLYMLVGISYFNGGKTAILRSSDRGKTFQIIEVTSQFRAHGNGMGRQTGEKLVVDPNNSNTLYCGTRWNGIFRSTNGGTTWTNLSSLGVTTTPNENGVSFVVVDKSSGTPGNNSQKIFVGISRSGNSNLFVSINGGTSFSAVTGAPTTYMPQRAVLASDGNLYITYGNGAGPHGHWAVPEPMDNGQIWKFNTSTGEWTNITPSGFNRAFGGISVDPANPQRLVASTINTYMAQYNSGSGTVWGDRMFISTNGGSSWRDLVGSSGIIMNPNGVSWINGHSIHWAGSIEFNPFNTNQVWVTSGNGVFSCDNVNAAQTTWQFNVKGLEETVPLDIVSITGGPLVSVIGDYDGFIHSDVTQYAPIHKPSMGTTTGIAVAAANTNKLLRVGNSMYYSNNQGTAWTQCSMNGQKGKVAISANGNIFLHNPESSSTMYRSANNGTSWTTVSGVNINEAVPVADQVNSNKFYAYNPSSGIMMVSTDGGVSFSNGGNAGTNGSKIIRTVPGQEGHIWIAMYNGGLKRSVNSGSTFTTISNVTYCAAVGLGKAAPGADYHAIYIWGTVGGVRGVFRSADQGVNWTRINSDDQEFGGPGNGQFVIGDMNVYGRTYMSTAGRGIVYVDSDPGLPLPVEMISFRAELVNDQVSLSWQTIREHESDYYIVEKSDDGNDFISLQNIKAAGNSNTIKYYNATDIYPYNGMNYYRIKQVDTNGSFTFSKVISVSVQAQENVFLYPNPASESFRVKFRDEIPVQLVEIYTTEGRLLLSTNNPGTDLIEIKNLPSGLYMVKVISLGYAGYIRLMKE